MTQKLHRLFNLALMTLLFSGITPVQATTCLDGFELTSIVVLENDIKQSVEAYACRIESADYVATYELYRELRQSWQAQRAMERARRDEVYKRIYGEAWQDRIVEWELLTAKREGKLFKPGEQACQALHTQIRRHLDDWQQLYDDAAKKAAGAVYDPLRCESLL